MSPRTRYGSRRAERLYRHARTALFAAGPFVFLDVAALLGSGGNMLLLHWGITAAIGLLGLIAAGCLGMAHHREAQFLAAEHARQKAQEEAARRAAMRREYQRRQVAAEEAALLEARAAAVRADERRAWEYEVPVAAMADASMPVAEPVPAPTAPVWTADEVPVPAQSVAPVPAPAADVEQSRPAPSPAAAPIPAPAPAPAVEPVVAYTGHEN